MFSRVQSAKSAAITLSILATTIAPNALAGKQLESINNNYAVSSIQGNESENTENCLGDFSAEGSIVNGVVVSDNGTKRDIYLSQHGPVILTLQNGDPADNNMVFTRPAENPDSKQWTTYEEQFKNIDENGIGYRNVGSTDSPKGHSIDLNGNCFDMDDVKNTTNVSVNFIVGDMPTDGTTLPENYVESDGSVDVEKIQDGKIVLGAQEVDMYENAGDAGTYYAPETYSESVLLGEVNVDYQMTVSNNGTDVDTLTEPGSIVIKQRVRGVGINPTITELESTTYGINEGVLSSLTNDGQLEPNNVEVVGHPDNTFKVEDWTVDYDLRSVTVHYTPGSNVVMTGDDLTDLFRLDVNGVPVDGANIIYLSSVINKEGEGPKEQKDGPNELDTFSYITEGGEFSINQVIKNESMVLTFTSNLDEGKQLLAFDIDIDFGSLDFTVNDLSFRIRGHRNNDSNGDNVYTYTLADGEGGSLVVDAGAEIKVSIDGVNKDDHPSFSSLKWLMIADIGDDIGGANLELIKNN